jgi:hypothetical protein
MAELLKRQYNLVVLKVEMRPSQPDVMFTLQAKVEGELTNIHVWLSSIEALGLLWDRTLQSGNERNRGTRGDGALPTDMVGEIAQWMTENIHDGQPLWVHLVKPYGALRFMPWERAFGSAFGHAILMLPDFLFPPPRESSETLDVALCATAPLNSEDGHVRHALHSAIAAILKASVRRTELHVFADAQLYPEVRSAAALVTDSNVTVTPYDPTNAAEYAAADLSSRLVDNTGQLRSPWLLWMRNELKNRSVDVVHMIGHGYLSRDRGALLMAQSPLERTNDFRAGPVSSIELCNFMTQLGAWGTVLTGVWDNHSPMGLRALADEIGQSRPGPVLMHSLDRDPNQSFLAPAYKLLFDTAPSGMPISDSLFVYCQPYRVGSGAADPFEVGTQGRTRSVITLESPVSRNYAQSAAAEEASKSASALDAVIQRSGPVKPWVSATERVAEQVQLKLQTSVRDDDDSDPVQSARKAASLSMLDSLRESVASFADEDAAAEMSAMKSAAKTSLDAAQIPVIEGENA